MRSNKNYFNETEQAILKTLIYSDLFDFPLTKQELWRFLISREKITKQNFESALKGLTHITYIDGYFCFSGRKEIVDNRNKNKPEVQKKLRIAHKAAYLLSFIPTIQHIGISGGLALGSADANDDIDFFIVTKKNTLFITRFITLVLLEAFNLRRKRDDKNPSNKICVNLLIDESALSWPTTDQNLYIAHEIIQMRPLFERNNTYDSFIKNNIWVKKFFPNFISRQSFTIKDKQVNYYSLKIFSFFLSFPPIEHLMQKFQLFFMKSHKTTEIVSKKFLAFHPNDYKIRTMSILRSECEKLGLLTNF